MTSQKKLTVILAATAVLLVGSWAGFGWATSAMVSRAQAQAAAQAEPTAVAVLNIQDVLGQLDEHIGFQQTTNAKNDELRVELERRQNALQQMQNDLEFLTPGTEAYSDKEDQIFDALIGLRTWQQIQEQRNILDQRTQLASLYRKIVLAGSEIAEQRGIDIVLLDTQIPDLDTLNPEQLLNAIATRKVLHHSEEVDMTRDVIELMNTQWNNR